MDILANVNREREEKKPQQQVKSQMFLFWFI